MDKPDLWWKNAVIYELYVDKFSADFKDLARRLDYLLELGIDCIHILPHYPSPMVDDGYDISDYRNIRSNLGTLEDFDTFIAAARIKKIRVMLDIVLNHVSSLHPWFIEARGSIQNPKRDFFLWSKTGGEFSGAPNPFLHLKSNNWIYNPPTKDYYFATFYPEQPDLNWGNPDVMREICAIMDFWIGRGVNGFRIDAASHLIKKEGTCSKGLPETHAILKKIHAHLNRGALNTALLAEVHDSISEVKKYFGAGNECHMVYNFPAAEKIFLSVINNDMSFLEPLKREFSGIPEQSSWAFFLRNHDDLSLSTMTDNERRRVFDFCDPERKYIFGRGLGLSMRLASIFKGDVEKIKKAFEILFNLSGASVLYYGDEIGMKNDTIAGFVADTRRYVRGQFQWDRAEREMSDSSSLFSFVQKLIKHKKAKKE